MQNQHYVSQVLLKNFSPDGKKGLINILEKPDKELLNQSIAKHAASELNYNTIETNGKENNIIEETASKLEADVGRIFQRMKKSNYIISKEDMSTLLYFGSLLFVNVPHFRYNIERFKNSVNDRIMNMLSRNENLLKNTIEKTNIPDKENINIKKLAESYRKGEIKFGIPKSDIILTSFRQINQVFEILSKMHWSFFVIKDEGCYITSDTPIVPMDRKWDTRFSGIGTAEAVVFPLTKKVCLIGQWKGKANNVEITGEHANGVNLMMLKFSSYVYMPITQKELLEQFNRYP